MLKSVQGMPSSSRVTARARRDQLVAVQRVPMAALVQPQRLGLTVGNSYCILTGASIHEECFAGNRHNGGEWLYFAAPITPN